jgi:hypothetical protein
LPGFPYAPHFHDWQDLRMHYVDEGPKAERDRQDPRNRPARVHRTLLTNVRASPLAAVVVIDLQRSELRDWIQSEWVERRKGSEGSDRKVARRTEGEASALSLRA